MYWLTHYWPRTYVMVATAAFMFALVGMPVAVWSLKRLRILDDTAAHKIHAKPVPRGGGIIMFFAFAAAVLLPGYRSAGMNGILIGAFICLCVGALDDFTGGIPGFWKLITLVFVTLVLWRFGVRLNVFKFAPFDIAFTLLWIVGVTSAFNGLDNMDGLASGVSVIVSAVYFVIALQVYATARTETSLSWFGMLAMGLMGANLGFLVFNSSPARIFMGDSGSFFLGFTLAALGVMGEWTENRIISCTIPILILGVPVFDFAYILIARVVRGETRTIRQMIDHCGMDHLSHRLVWIGFSKRNAVLFIYLLSLTLGVTGILLRNSTSLLDSSLALFQGLAILAVVVILMASAAKRHIALVHDEVEKLNGMDAAASTEEDAVFNRENR
ncbi:MAG TPA: MraY family glycosyltransferase [Candidatus Hydrogenedentes bacterium]|nr:MraY family glycosyltransferase [Candidatus Hydrogenedentota bacterium]HPG69719.1 MraY family glycosyltransferase [Candidatus Hydrogenedentota bacterium]